MVAHKAFKFGRPILPAAQSRRILAFVSTSLLPEGSLDFDQFSEPITTFKVKSDPAHEA